MAITINVQGAPASGGGGNNQNPTPQSQQPTPTPAPQPSNPPSQQPQPTGGQNNSSNSIPFTVTQGAPTQPASPQPTQQPNTGSQQNQPQPTTQTVTPTGQNPPANQLKPSQPIIYQRPDFNQFKSNGQSPINQPLPTSERMVNDVRAEISRRGIILVPGTQNFSTMLNTLHQQQRGNIMGQIDSVHDARIQDIDKRDTALYTEIKARLDASRQSELDGVTDPVQASIINKHYDDLEYIEFKNAGKFFAGEYAQVKSDRSAQKAEAEQRLTEALQRLTEELSQGNKDSYLGQLRDKYKTAIWKRDNAATEEEVREASREASKVQERMQRAMGGGGGINWGHVATIAIGGISRMANIYAQGERLEDQRKWGLPIQMARSVLGGNPYAAYSQQATAEQQRIENNWALGGAAVGTAAGIWGGISAGMAAGAAAGSVVPGAGTIVGALVGTAIAAAGAYLGSQGGYFFGGGQELEKEKKKADAADLWTQVESRIIQFNGLAMLMRPSANGASIGAIRDTFINQANVEQPGMAGGAFVKGDNHLDLYDLGYSAPEFAQQVVGRTKARGFSTGFNDAEYALRQDALEKYYNMAPNTIGALSQYDRFGKNNANQDFANLATTLSALGTKGMSESNGGFVRGEEFAGYMTQLQGQQRSTFLTVDNSRAGRQIATGQKIFRVGNEDRFGAEALQGIQQVNDRIQNPTGGFAQTLLYDVIQELFPDTRGRIDKIEQAQYDPSKQNRIQQEYQKRIESIYGGVDTTSGYLAAQDIWGIKNPNVMMPIVKQLSKKGGLEAQGLKRGNVDEITDVLNTEEYTPKATQSLKHASDQQTSVLIRYQSQMVDIANDILTAVKKDLTDKLDEAIAELSKVNN